ncbi:DUF6923 family protein [Comamonas odontotermitis]|uniref:DUF6923 family protein n=1 Tax=Comamonas odontotermitis TaxID=379895 RepID=UPI001CC6AC64|nr:DUF11 domain-containing protein [Comamonas odontotermitis]UBB15763.1 DUF11 domain-containing protein [Comamonas odontotermitis]
MTSHVCALSEFFIWLRQSAKNIGGVLRTLTMLAAVAPVLAMAASCDDRMFLSQNGPTQLSSISTATTPLTFSPIGGTVAGRTYNALAYSPNTCMLYAISSTNSLLTIDPATGAVIGESAVTHDDYPDFFVLGTLDYNAGTVGSDGMYYVRSSGYGNMIYVIDTIKRTATWIFLDNPLISISDMAWVGGPTGGLYAVDDDGQLYSIGLDGHVTPIGTSDPTGGVLGAQFGGTNGLFGSANDGSGFYKIDLTTGKKTLISGAPGSSTNDGANNPHAPITFPADLSIAKTNNQSIYTPGTDVTYTIQVTNNGPFAAQSAKIVDALPSGITTASWSCTASNGGTCTASGTGGISDTIDLPKGAVAIYTLTMSVPSGLTGNLANIATVAFGDASTGASVINTDPVPNNNSATDTDTPKVPTTPGGVGATPVPTLGEWTSMVLSAVLAGFVALRLRGVCRSKFIRAAA